MLRNYLSNAKFLDVDPEGGEDGAGRDLDSMQKRSALLSRLQQDSLPSAHWPGPSGETKSWQSHWCQQWFALGS